MQTVASQARPIPPGGSLTAIAATYLLRHSAGTIWLSVRLVRVNPNSRSGQPDRDRCDQTSRTVSWQPETAPGILCERGHTASIAWMHAGCTRYQGTGLCLCDQGPGCFWSGTCGDVPLVNLVRRSVRSIGEDRQHSMQSKPSKDKNDKDLKHDILAVPITVPTAAAQVPVSQHLH